MRSRPLGEGGEMLNARLNCVLGTVLLSAVLSLGMLCAQSVPDILYLRFEEGSGTVANDAAIPGTGTIGNLSPQASFSVGNAAIGLGSLLTGLTASEGCIVLNPVIPSTLSYTIEFWFEIWTGGGQIFPYGQTCNNTTSYLAANIVYNAPGLANFQIWSNGTSFSFSSVPVAGVIGNWCHVAITSDQATSLLTLYINGQPFGSVPVTSFVNLQTLIGTGINVGGALTSNCFLGAGTVPTGMDDFRIWSTARSAADIAANYQLDLLSGGDFLGASAPPSLIFNTALGTFSSAGIADLGGSQATPITLPPSSLPAGTTMIVTGNFTGTDVQSISDITLSPVTVRFTAVPNSDELVIQGLVSALAGPPPTTRFQGTSGVVASLRALTSIATPIVTRIGQGSLVLDRFATELQTANFWSLVVEYGLSAPRVVGVVADFVQPVVAPESRLTTDGLGSVLLGDIGMAPGARLFHIFALQPATAAGAGPFFGLELTPIVYTQIQMPFPVTPFKVAANAAGAYMFLAGPGSLPAGFTVDTVTIELVPPAFGTIGYVSPARRVTF